jgi:hypothetical protein
MRRHSKGATVCDTATEGSVLPNSYRICWYDKVPIAAYELGHVYEIGLPVAAASVDSKLQVDVVVLDDVHGPKRRFGNGGGG